MKIWFQFLFRWNKNIRLSCAYLFQIKQDGKYLLIKGNRIEQYQPVGGVYKYYNSFNEVKSKLELEDESESHFYENGDLKLITKGRYLIKFLAYKQKIFNIYEVKIPSDMINMVLSSDRYCLVEVEEIEKFCCMRDNLSKKIFKTVLSDNEGISEISARQYKWKQGCKGT